MTRDSEPKLFGALLRKLRKNAGLTQQELAQELGVSRRSVDYYERESHQPPAHLLAILAQVLNVTVDELLGIKPLKNETPKLGARLERRLRQIEKLNPKAKKQILQILDTFIEAKQFSKQ